MTSILKQENGELFIYRNKLGLPDKSGEYYNEYDFDEELYNEDCQLWFSSSERIKVAEGEKEHFRDIIFDRMFIERQKTFEQLATEGIKIPESCYEVRYWCTTCKWEFNIDCRADNCTADELAYFKDDRADKTETAIPKGTSHWDCCGECHNYPGCCFIGQCHAREKQLNRPHENTSLDPKEHAIQFAEWASESGFDYYDGHWNDFIYEGEQPTHIRLTSEEFYDVFKSRK